MKLALPAIVDAFKDDLHRMDLRFETSRVKVVVTTDVPELVVRFNEGKAIKIGPLKKDGEVMVPVWLARLLKERGHALLHKDERTDDAMDARSEHKLAGIDPFFYQKTIDWLDTVETLGTKGLVSSQMPKRLRSKFTSFLNIRLKQIFDSISLPASTLAKKLSKDEFLVARYLQSMLDAWERHVLKREK